MSITTRSFFPGPQHSRADLDARQDLLSLLEGDLGLWDATGLLGSDDSLPDPLLITGVGPAHIR